MAKPKGKKRQEYRPVSAPQAVRDVLVAAINKGQLPILGVILVAIIMVLRLPEDRLAILADDLMSAIKQRQILGWIVALLSLGAWMMHAKSQRRSITAELRRISDERNELQQRLLGQELESSDAQ